VQRITCRKNPILLDLLAEHPPSEGSKLKQISTEAIFHHALRENVGLDGIKEVVVHEESGGWGFFVIQMKVRHPGQPWQALNAAASLTLRLGKIIVVVDEDIDPRDLDAVLWALVFRMQPNRDILVVPGRGPNLDPSVVPPTQPGWHHHYPQPHGSTTLLVNATRKWEYPPVALPAKEYMEKARSIWEEEGLPELKPKSPWHGYTLGYWPQELAEAAAAVAAGREPPEPENKKS
jgi:4-hydroxy-3-polyprenylbenzoate decarboxylase